MVHEDQPTNKSVTLRFFWKLVNRHNWCQWLLPNIAISVKHTPKYFYLDVVTIHRYNSFNVYCSLRLNFPVHLRWTLMALIIRNFFRHSESFLDPSPPPPPTGT